MSLGDKIDKIYNEKQTVQRDPDAFRNVAETMFAYVSEDLIKKAERGAIDRSGLFGGGRPYVRTDIFVNSFPSFPKDHIVIDDRKTVRVNSFNREGRKLYIEIKKLASREGIKCFTGNNNIGFEYYIRG